MSRFATATNTGVASITFPSMGLNGPQEVAITPDGKHAYAPESSSNYVFVIDTATNTLEAATITVGNGPSGVAITPDGKHVYVTNSSDNTVSVIDTVTNTVVATVGVGIGPAGIAITPDGKYAYVVNSGSSPNFLSTVSVIDTAGNMVVGTPIPVGTIAGALAITPDGKHVYVTGNAVSVIDTATNTVVATVAVAAAGVGIMPPPVGVPFLAFNAKLAIDLDRKPNTDRFELESHFTLSSSAPAIDPVTDPVTLQIGSFTTTIPAGSFKKHRDGDGDADGAGDEHEHEGGVFTFHGVIDGVRLEALIKPTGTLRYAFNAEGKGANLAGTKNPVQVIHHRRQ
jgi:YVTN family beta-propeller protein